MLNRKWGFQSNHFKLTYIEQPNKYCKQKASNTTNATNDIENFMNPHTITSLFSQQHNMN